MQLYPLYLHCIPHVVVLVWPCCLLVLAASSPFLERGSRPPAISLSHPPFSSPILLFQYQQYLISAGWFIRGGGGGCGETQGEGPR